MRSMKPLLMALLVVMPLWASADDELSGRPVELRMTMETVELPGQERMGMLGGTYFFQLSPGFWLGPAAYGAVTGQRGGFFTGGVDLAWKRQILPSAYVRAGAYLGGGGGGSAAVGGGLMWRPYVELGWQGDAHSLGLSASQVRFPNGSITSRQVGLVFSMNETFEFASIARAGTAVQTGGRGGVGFDRISVVGGRYRPDASSRDVNGAAYGGSVGYAGFQADQMLSEHAFWGIESGAAISGGADGYAEILGVLGLEQPLWGDRLRVGARAAAGLGGGGRIATQGGVILKTAIHARAQLSRHLSLALEAGRISAPDGQFKARTASMLLGLDLDLMPHDVARQRVLQGMAWEAKFSRYTSAARYSLPTQPFDTVGFAINRHVHRNFYVTGQALSAVDGKAGGYSMGLVGVGAMSALAGSGVHVGVEILGGAAGGGGVNTQGGAVLQAVAYAAHALPGGTQLKLGVGRVKSRRGELDSPLIDLSLSVPFSVPAKR